MPPKGTKKGTNAAPWWWEEAVCELWAAEGKPKRRQKFHGEAIEALDAAHGGDERALVWQRTGWGSADALFNTILTARNATVAQARAAAIQGGLCLRDGESILQHMSAHLQHMRDGNPLVVCEQAELDHHQRAVDLLQIIHELHQRHLVNGPVLNQKDRCLLGDLHGSLSDGSLYEAVVPLLERQWDAEGPSAKKRRTSTGIPWWWAGG
eukprot:TRINITY_DN26173_c0_g1_i2.p1 TRINITY_DN26173_c0_g1~~TRINITY_DN26173_c0_g1_i2.p1  ORF type:complete len:209 (+),score=56.31 TRINITY_DN26173_c0_g1_i2:178-804(+)